MTNPPLLCILGQEKKIVNYLDSWLSWDNNQYIEKHLKNPLVSIVLEGARTTPQRPVDHMFPTINDWKIKQKQLLMTFLSDD